MLEDSILFRDEAGLLFLYGSMALTDLIMRSNRVLRPATFLRFAGLRSEMSTEFARVRETLVLKKCGHDKLDDGEERSQTNLAFV